MQPAACDTPRSSSRRWYRACLGERAHAPHFGALSNPRLPHHVAFACRAPRSFDVHDSDSRAVARPSHARGLAHLSRAAEGDAQRDSQRHGGRPMVDRDPQRRPRAGGARHGDHLRARAVERAARGRARQSLPVRASGLADEHAAGGRTRVHPASPADSRGHRRRAHRRVERWRPRVLRERAAPRRSAHGGHAAGARHRRPRVR